MPPRGVHRSKEVHERKEQHKQTVHVDHLLKRAAEEVAKALRVHLTIIVKVMMMTVVVRVNVLKLLLLMMVVLCRLRIGVEGPSCPTVAT